MHGRIFEIREQRIDREDWMNEQSLYDEDTNFCEYYQNSNDREYDLEWLKDTLPASMFRMEGDEIEIISDGKEVVEEWIASIKETVNKLDYQSVTDPLTMYRLKKKMEGMLYTGFMFRTDSSPYIHNSTEFAMDCVRYCQGKKLYVCGIIDYKF